MTFISGFRRSIVAAGGVTLSVVLAACSGGAGDESPASGSQSTETSSSQTTPGVDIANPKDATAVDVCSLLPEEAAQKLGVQAQGEKESNLTSSESSTEPCVWESEYGATSVSLAPLSNSSIKQYLDGSDSYSDFKELTISGHPAVRANRNDPMTGEVAIYSWLRSRVKSFNPTRGLIPRIPETSIPVSRRRGHWSCRSRRGPWRSERWG